MPNEFDETDDIALDIEDIPTYRVGTAGIASASQLVDQTAKVEISSDSTA